MNDVYALLMLDANLLVKESSNGNQWKRQGHGRGQKRMRCFRPAQLVQLTQLARSYPTHAPQREGGAMPIVRRMILRLESVSGALFSKNKKSQAALREYAFEKSY